MYSLPNSEQSKAEPGGDGGLLVEEGQLQAPEPEGHPQVRVDVVFRISLVHIHAQNKGLPLLSCITTGPSFMVTCFAVTLTN